LRRPASCIVELDEQRENENMDRGLQKLAVVNCADSGNKSKREGCARIRSVNGLRLLWWNAAARRRCLALNEFRKTRLAINRSTHVARALWTERLSAADAERGRRRICVVNTIHQEISLTRSICDRISVTTGAR